MGQGERIEWINPCPLTPSSKRSLNPQGIKKSLNLHFRPIPIWVAVSLTIILMASGLMFFWILFPDMILLHMLEQHYDPIFEVYIWVAGMGWSGITLLAGLMIIKKSLNLHSRPNPFKVAISLTIILVASGLVIFWMLIPNMFNQWFGQTYGQYDKYFLIGGVGWSGITLLAGLMILVPDDYWRIDRGQTGVREFNKTKATSTLVEEERGERKRGEERKLKHLKTAFLVVLLIVIGVAITPLVAETAGDASSIMNLRGPRIWIAGEGVPESGEYTISADEYAHVHHGWNSKGQYDPKINWSELSELERDEFIGTSTFELTIDGDPIELSCAKWLDSELDVYFVIYYIQFKPGDLSTSTHTFTGTWYSEVNGTPYTDESGTCPITLNVTVNVV